jgi:hypothetical protein
MKPVPLPEDLSGITPVLAGMVASHSWLPHRDVVAKLSRAVFPTRRYKKTHPRLSEIVEGGQPIGMYDDNATPEWAFLWSHGMKPSTRKKGWTVAHVWPTSDDLTAYTHVANLALVPEAFASLTDKTAPLTEYLRWHAWAVYGWKPQGAKEPAKPEGFDSLSWRYFPPVLDPLQEIHARLKEKRDQRSKILYPIMESRFLR